jgi:hypothetical protein
MAELGSAAPTSGGVRLFLSSLMWYLRVTWMNYSYTSGHTPCHLRGVEIYWHGLLGVSLL